MLVSYSTAYRRELNFRNVAEFRKNSDACQVRTGILTDSATASSREPRRRSSESLSIVRLGGRRR